MPDNENKYTNVKCGYNCKGCLCADKHYNGGNKDPEKCTKGKEDKKEKAD